MSYYALMDCNNFYVSCERLFNPKLEGRPVIALSNNDGCVVARSQEAKQLGIKMGEPYFKILDLCKQRDVFICSSNYTVYGELSQRVMNIIAQMSPEIQIYSIDEAFATFPDTFPEKEVVAHCLEIRRVIKKWIGIPISVGIAPTKTLSKMANDLAKKNRALGIFNLYPQSVQNEVLKHYPIQDVWGIGSQLATKLRSQEIYTAAEFRDADPPYIRKLMGVVGERMLWELRGISCLPLKEPSPKKSITCSRSFGTTVTEMHHLEEALAMHVNTACIELREQNSCASALCIFIEALVDAQKGTRRPFSTVIPFTMPSNNTPLMISAAKQYLPQIFVKGMRYKKCGVILLDLLPKANVFPDLFLGGVNPRREKLMHTVDALNERFGKNTLFYGAMGINPVWKMRRDKCSSNYTSDWNDLAIAKA
jgi:DNA polymerase V